MRNSTIAITMVFILAAAMSARAQGGEEDARKHLVRGMAAIESAKNADELADAVDEFKKATELAPDMAEAWYNLGSVQAKTGQFKEAIASYQRYLELSPNAEDTARIKDEITKLEFRMEKEQKIKSRAGIWLAEDGTPFNLNLNGNTVVLATSAYYVSKADVESTYTMVGNVPVSILIPFRYNLSMQGKKLSGIWSRPSFKADKCTVPEDGGEVTGELLEDQHLLVLRYTYTRFHASTQMSLLTDDFCREVTAVEKKDIEKKFYGPLPKGGIGVYLDGVHSYWPGGFSMVKFGWTGHLVVYGLKKDSPSYIAGLRDRDEILSIDGVPVASLSVVDALTKLRGEPGSEVVLTLIRNKKADAPVTVRLKRIAIPDDQVTMN